MYYRNKKTSPEIILILIVMALAYKFPILIVVGVIVFIVKWYLRRQKSGDESNEEGYEVEKPFPYRKRTFLLTRAEYEFDKVLRESVGDKYEIERQVLLSKLIEVTTEDFTDYKTGRKFNPDRSKIDKKTVDFVLYNRAGYTPHLVIELDDSSHERQDRQERDSFVEDVLEKVGIKLLRIKNAYNYNVSDITELIQ